MRKVFAKYNSSSAGARPVSSATQVLNGRAVSYGLLAPGNTAWVYETDIIQSRPGSRVWWTNPLTNGTFAVQSGRITDPMAWFEGSQKPVAQGEAQAAPEPEEAVREEVFMRLDAATAMDELTAISGIGEATARKLAGQGLTVGDLRGLSVEELKELGIPAVSAGRVHESLSD